MAAGKANVYEMVTARIIAELEKGNIPWEKPWTGTQTGAFNRISKKPYSLINQMLLCSVCPRPTPGNNPYKHGLFFPFPYKWRHGRAK